MTREQWLNALADKFRPLFSDTGFILHEKLRISVGWPSHKALSRKKRVVGQCWSPECSTDGSTEIFISPFLGDAYQAAETLLHEMIHACGLHGHKGNFITCAKKLGFTTPWTSTPASDDLRTRIMEIVGTLPGYPHATLDQTAMEKLAKKQSTRLIKCECADCKYVVRTTKKWLDDKGAPICPCNQKPMLYDAVDVEEEMAEAA
jgi:hypothetical protein